jgi:hypothetical protein
VCTISSQCAAWQHRWSGKQHDEAICTAIGIAVRVLGLWWGIDW